MNVNLRYDIEFPAGIYFDDTLQLGYYSVAINLCTATKDPLQINIAMERTKEFVRSILGNTVFISEKDQERIELLDMLNVNVTTLPEEPVDQIIGMMLYYKLNAIMEGRIIVTELDLSSNLGDNVWYSHCEEDSSGPFAKDGWWHQPNTTHADITTELMPDNVLKVTTTGWHEYGLEWIDAEKPNNTVVFGDFNKK